MQKYEQCYYLWDGDKWRFRGSRWPVPPRLRHCRGAWDRHAFVLHVVYPITEGLNGVSCRDRDIKSFVRHCHPSEKPASRQTALSQLLGLLPNLWQWGNERGRRGMRKEEGKKSKSTLFALSVSLRVVWQANHIQQSNVCLWNLSLLLQVLLPHKTPMLSYIL